MTDVNTQTQQYCTGCDEIVSFGHLVSEHKGELHAVDTYPLHRTSDGLIAKPRGMGHSSQHVWITVAGREQCAECNAIKLEEDDG